LNEGRGWQGEQGHMSCASVHKAYQRANQQHSRWTRIYTKLVIASTLLCLAATVQACPHHASAQAHHLVVAQQQQQQQQAQSSEPTSISYEDWSNRDITAAAAVARRRTLLESSSSDRPQASSSSSSSSHVHIHERPGPRCGTRNMTAMEHHDIQSTLSRLRLPSSRLTQQQAGMMSIASVATPTSLTVDLYFHVISGDSLNATVNAPVELLAQQLDVMNGAYGPFDIRFALKGVTRVQSEEWATTEINTGAETAMKTRLRK
jgi:hypothetical protein